MDPEGVDSARVVPAMLAEGWTSAFAVGMPRSRDKSGSDREHARDVPISFFGRHPSGLRRLAAEVPRQPEDHVLHGRPPHWNRSHNAKALLDLRMGSAPSHPLPGFN